ncbi:hypothetical protein Tco_1066656 [Tanacetum coccineum]|uniref:Uncharacterized protein n=1 Tax=Tanacetum coccineum TaxID=301880 RepID=A0ABQ5HAP6_9ASTR
MLEGLSLSNMLTQALRWSVQSPGWLLYKGHTPKYPNTIAVISVDFWHPGAGLQRICKSIQVCLAVVGLNRLAITSWPNSPQTAISPGTGVGVRSLASYGSARDPRDPSTYVGLIGGGIAMFGSGQLNKQQLCLGSAGGQELKVGLIVSSSPPGQAAIVGVDPLGFLLVIPPLGPSSPVVGLGVYPGD